MKPKGGCVFWQFCFLIFQIAAKFLPFPCVKVNTVNGCFDKLGTILVGKNSILFVHLFTAKAPFKSYLYFSSFH